MYDYCESTNRIYYREADHDYVHLCKTERQPVVVSGGMVEWRDITLWLTAGGTWTDRYTIASRFTRREAVNVAPRLGATVFDPNAPLPGSNVVRLR